MVELLRESIACAVAHGAKRLISVSPIGVERLLRRTGIRSHRAGPPMIVDGHPIFACWIDCFENEG
jgi:N-acyl-L-homoserine lactone synthetase